MLPLSRHAVTLSYAWRQRRLLRYLRRYGRHTRDVVCAITILSRHALLFDFFTRHYVAIADYNKYAQTNVMLTHQRARCRRCFFFR